MQNLKKQIGITGLNDEEPEQESMEDTDDTEAFIRRLDIQRKLLNNFVDQTIAQMPEISMKKNK
jgi:hypothetical protein